MRDLGRGLGLFYLAALVPGLLLLGFGLRPDPAAETQRGPTAAPDSAIAAQIWESRTEAIAPPSAPVPTHQNVASTGSTCSDLRALFGLGEPLTDAQKRYLQERC